MKKDYDKWNSLKKNLQYGSRRTYAYPREVWWCSLGLNIGSETDGKHDNFERPVLVMNVYNKDTMLVLPFTTKIKNDKFHHMIVVCSINPFSKNIELRIVWLKLTQARVISNRRLSRKIDVISVEEFSITKEKFKDFI